MTDTPPLTPAPPPPTATVFEPSPGALEFVHNGIIRIHFPTGKDDDLIVRVRRPFLGELKTIRLALEQTRDDLAITATEVTIQGRDLQAEAVTLSDRLGTGEITTEEHLAALKDIRRRDRESAQRMDNERDDKTLAWWTLILQGDGTFPGLALDPVPDVMAYPAWIIDPRLPNLVLNHWRQIPSGPG